MIDLKFGLFWSGAPLSYLRYLTFASLRHHHPDAEIELYTTDEWSNDNYKWSCEKQDFEDYSMMSSGTTKDYMGVLPSLNIKILRFCNSAGYAPNYQSDFFRWWWLKNNNGFYLDTDQIILKSFNSLDRNYDFITTHYALSWGCDYWPVGVIGGSGQSEIVKHTHAILPKYYNKEDYNCIGPWAFRSIVSSKVWKDRIGITDPSVFYPVGESSFITPHYQNNDLIIPSNSYAFHWFGGLKASQEFNRVFSKDYALSHDDTFSKLCKKNNFWEECRAEL